MTPARSLPFILLGLLLGVELIRDFWANGNGRPVE